MSTVANVCGVHSACKVRFLPAHRRCAEACTCLKRLSSYKGIGRSAGGSPAGTAIFQRRDYCSSGGFDSREQRPAAGMHHLAPREGRLWNDLTVTPTINDAWGRVNSGPLPQKKGDTMLYSFFDKREHIAASERAQQEQKRAKHLMQKYGTTNAAEIADMRAALNHGDRDTFALYRAVVGGTA